MDFAACSMTASWAGIVTVARTFIIIIINFHYSRYYYSYYHYSVYILWIFEFDLIICLMQLYNFYFMDFQIWSSIFFYGAI